MTQAEIDRLMEIYEILISGRIDLARQELELLLFDSPDYRGPEVA